MMIDADLAKFVDYDGNAPAVFGGQDPVKKGRFAGSEKARENRNGHSLFVHLLHALEFPLGLFSKGSNEPAASQLCMGSGLCFPGG